MKRNSLEHLSRTGKNIILGVLSIRWMFITTTLCGGLILMTSCQDKEAGRISGVDCEHLLSIEQLVREKVYRNYDSAVVHFDYVYKLGLYNMDLTELPGDIDTLQHLQVLGASGNLLSRLPDAIKHIPCLQQVHLNNNRFTSFPMVLIKCRNLNTILMSENPLTSLPRELEHMSSLEYLVLNSNKLSEFPPVLLKIQNLKTLGLRNNGLRKIPAGISRLEKLEILDIRLNNISTLPESIEEMELKELILTGNPMTKDYVENLRLRMAGTKIEF